MMKKILVVDDNKNTTDLVQTILEAAGYACTTANSGRECLDLINGNRFDLILLDIAMPEITGIDVINTLKSDGRLSSNRVVFFTASSITASDKLEFQKIGALDCMKKPFTKSEILSFVSKYAS